MDFDRRTLAASGSAAAHDVPVAGKQTLTQSMVQMHHATLGPEHSEAPAGSAPTPFPRPDGPRPSLQMMFGRRPPASDPEQVHAAAARGTATAATQLPHLAQIQRSFGRHDVSSVQAHIGAEAAASAQEMGAAAYATGNHVVLGAEPDLHTVAHEAAHVVQQRGGVQLKGGVGAAGDAYEHHADAVADRVTAGQSAEDLLDKYAGRGGGAPQIQQTTKGAIANTDPMNPGTGTGALESTDALGATHQHAVAFGPLVNGCGSSMSAWLYPDDDIKGSSPSVRPSWWTAMNADAGTDSAWVSANVVQGHLLNEHLGGPGNDMRNLTPFAKSTNSQHHAYVEKAAKDVKARKNILRYTLVVDYSGSPAPAWFGGKIAATYLVNFAKGITCVLQEYDAKTSLPIGNEVTTIVSNAMTGQG